MTSALSDPELHCQTLGEYIRLKAERYAALPLFEAFRRDRIPVDRFPDFFKEQYMTARWFQDLIWATTEIGEGPYAAFAAEHRRRDSGHYRWMEKDLSQFGVSPMSSEDWFRLEWLPTRMQMSRILARCYQSSAEEKMIILACLESAGAVTLGTLFDYVCRHGLEKKSLYLGEPHVGIEQAQVGQLEAVAHGLLASKEPDDFALVDLVYGALETMFSEGGQRYYAEFISSRAS